MKKFLIIFIVFILLLALLIGRCSNEAPDILPEDNILQEQKVNQERAAFINENPDGSLYVEIPKDTTDVLKKRIIIRKAYTVSYNIETKIPNWVAWHLTDEHTEGDVPRDNSYYEDDEVPIPRATNEDYHGRGWSRGHMCPAGDNKWDAEAMRESNLLTNICPQHPSLNSGVWNVIERDCRKWAKKYGDVYIVCGPILMNREHETIGENKIVVPEAFFKVIFRQNPQPAAIGYVIRNNEGNKKRDMFVNTVDDVERITGIDFFPSLPDDIENMVEASANINDW